MKTYALICAYNEEKTVTDIISKTLKYVDKIIFVNDGSMDKTLENVQKRFVKNKNVIVITYPENRGKGYALITGFKHFLKEKGKTLVTIDADGQHDPSQIPVVRLMVEKGFSDVTIGSRYSRLEGYPKVRIYLNVIAVIAVLLATGAFFADIASGFRCYSRKAIKRILSHLSLYGFGIELETLKFFKDKNLRITTVPVSCSYATGKKQNITKIARGYFEFMWKYRKDILKRMLGMKVS